MNLTKEDAIYISNVFEDYFGHLERIDDYMREQKLASLADLPSNPLFPPAAGSESINTNCAVTPDVFLINTPPFTSNLNVVDEYRKMGDWREVFSYEYW